MSLINDKIIRFSSVLKIAYNFLAGRNYLKRKKFREKTILISVALPFFDFINGFPELIDVFSIRI